MNDDRGSCRLIRVSGRVQGVFYRASTRAKAAELGLTGYAINLDNGEVEVLVCGSAAAISTLEAWLWEGPTGARVTRVSGEYRPFEERAGFTTG